MKEIKIPINKIHTWVDFLCSAIDRKIAIRPMIKAIYDIYGGKELIGVEIGVSKGLNAKNILSFLNIKKLYLVDPYPNCITNYGKFHAYIYDSKELDSTKKKGKEIWYGKDFFEYAKKLLSKFENKIKFIRKTSEEAVSLIPNNLDFIYIDGNHDYEFVKKDIELYYPKVKSGGVIGGDDFNISFLGVCEAVMEFVKRNNLKLYGENSEWWIVKP